MGWTHTRSQIAVAKKRNPRADVTELLRQMKAERLQDHIERVMAEAPPLTQQQRDKIAVLLRGGRS